MGHFMFAMFVASVSSHTQFPQFLLRRNYWVALTVKLSCIHCRQCFTMSSMQYLSAMCISACRWLDLRGSVAGFLSPTSHGSNTDGHRFFVSTWLRRLKRLRSQEIRFRMVYKLYRYMFRLKMENKNLSNGTWNWFSRWKTSRGHFTNHFPHEKSTIPTESAAFTFPWSTWQVFKYTNLIISKNTCEFQGVLGPGLTQNHQLKPPEKSRFLWICSLHKPQTVVDFLWMWNLQRHIPNCRRLWFVINHDLAGSLGSGGFEISTNLRPLKTTCGLPRQPHEPTMNQPFSSQDHPRIPQWCHGSFSASNGFSECAGTVGCVRGLFMGSACRRSWGDHGPKCATV